MSKYPHEAFTIQGGCLCSAIRYTLSYPSQPNRPIVLPSSKSNGQGDIRLPQSAVCFCNDCRRSSSGLVLFAIMAPFHQTSFSLLHKRSASDSSPASDPLPGSSSVSCSKGRMEFVANEHFPPKVQLSIGHTSNFQDTYLTTYQSSEKALRAFCSVSRESNPVSDQNTDTFFGIRKIGCSVLRSDGLFLAMRYTFLIHLHQTSSPRSDIGRNGFLPRYGGSVRSGREDRGFGSVCTY